MATDNTNGVQRAPRASRQCVLVNRLLQTSRGPAAGPSPSTEAGSPGPSGVDGVIERLEAVQREVEGLIDGNVFGPAAKAYQKLSLARVDLRAERRQRRADARDWSGLMDEHERVKP